ncbi:MAG: response regulator [Butyrivibrio sp.]|nr:response regulator [Butyrivibrio sp.]
MDNKVLIVGKEKSFMVNAIQTGLKNDFYDVTVVKPKATEIARISNKPCIILLYLEEGVEDISEALVYLKDVIENNGESILLYLIGNDEVFENARHYIPAKYITGYFTRPLNVKDLSSRLDKDKDVQAKALAKKKILVVDDDGTMLRTIKSWLEDDYSVYMANSGMSAITFLAKNDVDLILLDYEMPIASGPQVLEMIRSEAGTNTIPVMFLTAKGDKESVMKVLGLKPEAYLLKNMGREALLSNLEEFFDKLNK